MNYSYLFVDNLHNHSYKNGLNELKTSIITFKRIQKYDTLQIFGTELTDSNIDYFKTENIIFNKIKLSRNYGKSDTCNPINILVEKIIQLMNFDDDKEIVLMDIDTSSHKKIPEDFFNPNCIVFDAVEYPIMQWRNLDKILPQVPWNQFDVNFNDSFMMYNTGVIYIPKKFRKELCEKALQIVDYLNQNFEPEERYGNKLDEQIALSIVCHDAYGRFGYIKYSSEYIHHHWRDRQNGIEWWNECKYKNFIDSNYKTCLNKIENITKLPISIGILSWRSNKTLRNTLDSYIKNGLFDIIDNVILFFQEISDEDRKLAKKYNVPFISTDENIGIGNAFVKLIEASKENNILLLEHDWELTEDIKTTFIELKKSIELLNNGYDCIRLRNVENPGYPLYSQNVYQGNELNHYDPIIDLTSPHLFECRHWIKNIDEVFPDKIQKENDYFVTTSRWSNFTNNPCIYKKDFYLEIIDSFKDKSKLLENDISYWWSRQNFKIAWRKGLFTHNDIDKYKTLK